MEELTFDLSRLQLVDHSDKWLEILKNSYVDIVNHAEFKELEDRNKLIDLDNAEPGVYQVFLLADAKLGPLDFKDAVYTFFCDVNQIQSLDSLLFLPDGLKAKLSQLEIEDCRYVTILFIKNQNGKVYYVGSYKPSEKVSLS